MRTEDDGRTQKRRKIHEEINFSKESIENEQRIKELRKENAKLGDDLARMTYRRAENESRLKAAEKKLDLQRIRLEKAKAEIEKLKSQKTSFLKENRELRSKAKRVNKLEEDLESLRASNSHQETELTRELLEIAEGLGDKVKSLKSKCAELKLKVKEYESIKPGVTPAVLKDEYHRLIEVNADVKAQLDVLRSERDELRKIHGKRDKRATNKDRKTEKSSSDRRHSTSDSNDDEFLPATIVDIDEDRDDEVGSSSDIEQERRNLRVRFEGYYALVSDAKYFEIDWKKYYKCIHGSAYCCRRCPREFTNLRNMKDHLWFQHYGGSFKCYYCDSSQNFICNINFKHHMKTKHSNVY